MSRLFVAILFFITQYHFDTIETSGALLILHCSQSSVLEALNDACNGCIGG